MYTSATLSDLKNNLSIFYSKAQLKMTAQDSWFTLQEVMI